MFSWSTCFLFFKEFLDLIRSSVTLRMLLDNLDIFRCIYWCINIIFLNAFSLELDIAFQKHLMEQHGGHFREQSCHRVLLLGAEAPFYDEKSSPQTRQPVLIQDFWSLVFLDLGFWKVAKPIVFWCFLYIYYTVHENHKKIVNSM